MGRADLRALIRHQSRYEFQGVEGSVVEEYVNMQPLLGMLKNPNEE